MCAPTASPTHALLTQALALQHAPPLLTRPHSLPQTTSTCLLLHLPRARRHSAPPREPPPHPPKTPFFTTPACLQSVCPTLLLTHIPRHLARYTDPAPLPLQIHKACLWPVPLRAAPEIAPLRPVVSVCVHLWWCAAHSRPAPRVRVCVCNRPRPPAATAALPPHPAPSSNDVPPSRAAKEHALRFSPCPPLLPPPHHPAPFRQRTPRLNPGLH